MSPSIFGSVKEKLSRKATTSSRMSSSEKAPRGRNPFSAPPPPRITVAAGDAPPPAYTSTPSSGNRAFGSRNASPAPSMASITSDSDPFAFLSTFDTVFLVDDSASMSGNRWKEVRDVLSAIAPICTQHDEDGIDIYFLNEESGRDSGDPLKPNNGYYNIKTPAEVDRIFTSVRPKRMTPTARRLSSILQPYVTQLGARHRASGDAAFDQIKPVNIIVLTDGEATDEPIECVQRFARKLDDIDAPAHQVGIQFFQVGNDDEARAALEELDDGLAAGGIRDMVDTVTWGQDLFGSRTLSADKILKVVLGAVVRRIDRKRMSGEQLGR